MLNPIGMAYPSFWNNYLKYLDPSESTQRSRLEILNKFGLEVIAQRRADLAAEAQLEAELQKKKAEARASTGGKKKNNNNHNNNNNNDNNNNNNNNNKKKKKKAKKKASQRADLLTFFLQQQEKEFEKRQPTDEERSAKEQYLIDIVLNFIIAGRDTTASTLSWATHECLEHPDEMAILIDELDTVLEGREPTYEDIFERLPKLRMFLNESLRLHPPVPKDAKTSVEDDTLPDGTFVPAGTMMVYVPYVMGRDTGIWGEDAAEFRPMRWETQQTQQQGVSQAAMALSVNSHSHQAGGADTAAVVQGRWSAGNVDAGACPISAGVGVGVGAGAGAGAGAGVEASGKTGGACPFPGAEPKLDRFGLTQMLQPDSYHAPVFQGGPRTCIGREMAYFEASLVLSMVLQKYTLTRKSPASPGVPIATPGESLVMPINEGVHVYVAHRSIDNNGIHGSAAAAAAAAAVQAGVGAGARSRL
jgi:hypothetical protein